MHTFVRSVICSPASAGAGAVASTKSVFVLGFYSLPCWSVCMCVCVCVCVCMCVCVCVACVCMFVRVCVCFVCWLCVCCVATVAE